MKTILIGLTLLASLNAFSAQTEEYTATGLTGDSCTLSIGPALDSDYDNVLFRAKIGGKAIPQFLGFGTSKYFKSFAMVQFEHDGRLVSVGSEGDPDLELFFGQNGMVESYTLNTYPMFGGVETINCTNLKLDN